MLPERRPTTSSPPSPETFAWPPSSEELDAIEVIVLDDSPALLHPAPRPAPRRTDIAHWGLTLTSLLAIVVALVLQFVNWRVTPEPRAAQAVASPTLQGAASPTLPSSALIAWAPSPLALSATPAPTREWVPPARQPAPAYVPVRKPRPRPHDMRADIDSPPLRLPESYVQPRLVSTGDSRRVRGQVILGVQVRANGRVGNIDVLSDDGESHPNLERAAVAAVKQWRYRPALRDGVPTPARLKVIVKFS